MSEKSEMDLRKVTKSCKLEEVVEKEFPKWVVSLACLLAYKGKTK